MENANFDWNSFNIARKLMTKCVIIVDDQVLTFLATIIYLATIICLATIIYPTIIVIILVEN